MSPTLNLTNSPCPYFDKCGGCDFLDLNNKEYQNLKSENPKLQNYSNIEWIWLKHGLRRRITLHISNSNQLGFFIKKSKNLVPITSCYNAESQISELIPYLQKFLHKQPSKLFKQIVITAFDNGIDLIFNISKALNFKINQQLVEFGQKHNCNISTSLNKNIHPLLILRKNQISYDNFNINLESDIFIQATSEGLKNINNIITQTISNYPKKLNIIDIYCGFGAYSFAIGNIAKKISAFEGNLNMVNSIKENAKINNLSHKISAYNRDLFLNPIKHKELNQFDLAIINPPRNGASPQIKEIAKSEIKQLIYVSCNIDSFKQDAKILIDLQFKVSRLVALDQFYATKHLEIIAIFTK